MSQGDIIRKFRQGRGLSQVDLARLVGCSSQRISNIERGATALSADMAAKMAQAFGVSVDELTSETMPDIVRLAPDEKRLLEKYRSLTEKDRRILTGIMDLLFEGRTS